MLTPGAAIAYLREACPESVQSRGFRHVHDKSDGQLTPEHLKAQRQVASRRQEALDPESNLLRRSPKWRVTVDEDGQYCFAVVL
jgi:hypothetical protein